VLLFAIEPPDDDTQLIVGIDKANAPPAHRQLSTGKCHAITRCFPRGLGGRRDHRLTQTDIPQRHERYRTDRDHRRNDHWPVLLLLLITAWSSAPTSSPSTRSPAQTRAADKAINQWLKIGRIMKKEGGVYELGNG
jgi:hypothetical protein